MGREGEQRTKILDNELSNWLKTMKKQKQKWKYVFCRMKEKYADIMVKMSGQIIAFYQRTKIVLIAANLKEGKYNG